MIDKTREALEREQFEKWAATQPRHEGVSMRYLTLNNAYVDYELHGAWLAWQARAALAAPVVEAGAPTTGVARMTDAECWEQGKPDSIDRAMAADPTTVDLNLWKHRILPQGTEQPSSLHWDEPERRDVLPQADAERLVAECAPYLKEDETPLQRIERDHRDMMALMRLLAAEKIKNEALTAPATSGGVSARPPAVEAEPVRRLVDAAMAVISRHDEWVRQMPAGAFDDPLSGSLAALHDAAETVGISLGIAPKLEQPK